MEKTKMVKVTNRSNGPVGYNIPDAPAGYERNFAPGQTLEVEYEEVKKLYWTTGGRVLINEYFTITDEEVLGDLGIVPEPEYFYTKDDVKELLLNGSYEQLEDALEFGPQGVIELIKDLAVDLRIPDVNKRELISEKTGANISQIIALEKQLNETPVVEEKKTRRAEPVKAVEKTPTRKAAPVSKYKPIEK